MTDRHHPRSPDQDCEEGHRARDSQSAQGKPEASQRRCSGAEDDGSQELADEQCSGPDAGAVAMLLVFESVHGPGQEGGQQDTGSCPGNDGTGVRTASVRWFLAGSRSLKIMGTTITAL